MSEIVNKVAQSDLKTIDLAQFHDPAEKFYFDLKDLLFQGQILREKEFRDYIKEHNWNSYQGMNVAVGCSAEAIIPAWAYMLIVSKMEPYAKRIVIGSIEMLENEIFRDAISRFPVKDFQDEKIIIKGCGDVPIPDFAYAEITRILRPVAASIMYGEPCSTVPVFKKQR